MTEPTPFSDLNGVLAELVRGVQAALAANVCGVYLVGSFAVGDADRHSDVDFLVVTERQVSQAEEAALQALHGRVHDLPAAWAQHLEGSYVPKEALRRVDPGRQPLLYLDNGARELIWDDHCNTALVRWSLREHGIALAGPSAERLVDPVSEDELRGEARDTLQETAAWAHALADRRRDDALAFSRWAQPYLVLSCCRMLHTLTSGTIVSKQTAGTWALATLDSRWHPLIRAALDDRPNPWQRVRQAAPADAVAETVAFVEAAANRTAQSRSHTSGAGRARPAGAP